MANNCNYYSKKPKKKSIFLECGFNPQDAVFEIDDGEVEENQAFVLDRILIDTSGLIAPIMMIDFSGLIVFAGEDEGTYEPEVEVDLLFRLDRICNGVSETIQTWRYQKEIDVEDDNETATLELELEISEPFFVTYCDRNCPGCCEYRIVVEGKDFEGEFDYLRVAKPILTAIVQGEVQDYY
ncbi:MAG: DUF4489 domain-containing protein [Clostridiales bacterium]|nr:DUF4489 domain-containing protein [Clostridiales bacterium]